MFSQVQQELFTEISQGCAIDLSGIDRLTVEQTPDYVKNPFRIHDFATTLHAALGTAIEALGRERGLPPQELRIDRRHAGLSLLSVIFHFQNGWPISELGTTQATSQLYPDKNGDWLHMMGEYPHLRRGLLRYLNCPDDPAAIAAATRKRSAQQMEDDLAELSMCAAKVRTKEEWAQHPQGEYLTGTPPVSVAPLSSSGRKALAPAKARALEGVRILSLSHVLAGPSIGRLLSEHGADVIELRNPYFPYQPSFEADTGYGRRSMWAVLTQDASKRKFEELLSSCDVLVWGYRPGGLERLGYSREKLLAINPNLVLVRLNAYGFGGPWESRRGWEQLAQTVTGLVAGSSPHDDPILTSLPCDYGTGILGALGTVDALARRQAEGGAWEVQVSLARTGMLAAAHSDPKATAEPLTHADIEKYTVDQPTPGGIFTRVEAPVHFSLTPAIVSVPSQIMGNIPMSETWYDDVPDELPPVPHYPSKLAREQRLLVPDAPYGVPLSSALGKKSLPPNYSTPKPI